MAAKKKEDAGVWGHRYRCQDTVVTTALLIVFFSIGFNIFMAIFESDSIIVPVLLPPAHFILFVLISRHRFWRPKTNSCHSVQNCRLISRLLAAVRVSRESDSYFVVNWQVANNGSGNRRKEQNEEFVTHPEGRVQVRTCSCNDRLRTVGKVSIQK